MPRRLIPAALALLALVLSGQAVAAGVAPAGAQDGLGLLAGGTRYVALPGKGSTDVTPSKQPLRKESSFLVLDRQNLQLRTFAHLRGDFSFDALSPDGRYLFLVQHVSSNDTSR